MNRQTAVFYITVLFILFSGLVFPLNCFAVNEKITLFAAASTTNAVTEISRKYEKKHPVKIVLSFASSSTLAKQINQGAPAQVFISANPRWMDFLEKNGRIQPGTRQDLLGNRIVMISPSKSQISLKISRSLDLAGILGKNHLAMGDPDHVPAGIYGRQALESLGLWSAVAPKVARAKDVRAALVLVERAEVPLGIVYATDAAISKKVKVVGAFPEETHPPITYPLAMVAEEQSEAVAGFVQFLKSPEAREVFEKFGFSVR